MPAACAVTWRSSAAYASVAKPGEDDAEQEHGAHSAASSGITLPAKSSVGASTTPPTRQSQNATVSGVAWACRSRLERMTSTANAERRPDPAGERRPAERVAVVSRRVRRGRCRYRPARARRARRSTAAPGGRAAPGPRGRAAPCRTSAPRARRNRASTASKKSHQCAAWTMPSATRARRCGPGRRRCSRRVASATTASVIAASASRRNARGAAPTATAPAMTAMRPQEVARPARPRFHRIRPGRSCVGRYGIRIESRRTAHWSSEPPHMRSRRLDPDEVEDSGRRPASSRRTGRAGSPLLATRAPCGGGRSGGSRRRVESRTSGSRAARAGPRPRPRRRELGEPLHEVALLDRERSDDYRLKARGHDVRDALRRIPAIRACAYWT